MASRAEAHQIVRQIPRTVRRRVYIVYRGFAVPPPSGFGLESCALYAATAEYLCRRYGLPVPAWTEETQFFLEGRWEPLPNFEPEMEGVWVPFPLFGTERTWERTPGEFRRRGLVFEARKLIAL